MIDVALQPLYIRKGGKNGMQVVFQNCHWSYKSLTHILKSPDGKYTLQKQNKNPSLSYLQTRHNLTRVVKVQGSLGNLYPFLTFLGQDCDALPLLCGGREKPCAQQHSLMANFNENGKSVSL